MRRMFSTTRPETISMTFFYSTGFRAIDQTEPPRQESADSSRRVRVVWSNTKN